MKLVVLKRAFVPELRGFTLVELIVDHGNPSDFDRTGAANGEGGNQVRERARFADGFMGVAGAIDRYKDAADRGAFQLKVGSEGYPPDLETLIKGVDVAARKCASCAASPSIR